MKGQSATRHVEAITFANPRYVITGSDVTAIEVTTISARGKSR
jgi:hypothetical protein